MNYIDIKTFNNASSEWDFYLCSILGNANVNPTKKQLIEFVLTPTYYINNDVYFDYRSSMVNLLITTPLTKYRKVLSQVLAMKEVEDTYQFPYSVSPFKNDYSIYTVIYNVLNLNRWEIDSDILLNITPATEFNNDLIMFNRYDVLKQLDVYLNTNIADSLWGLYQRTYKLK